MRVVKYFFSIIVIACCATVTTAQQPLYLNYYKTPQNTLPLTGYYQIGGYKVKGNPYYKVDFILGNIYSVTETAKNIYLRYDVYNQKVEFISSANQDQILVKDPGDLDSFFSYKKESKEIVEDIKFVYGTIIGFKDKFYYGVLCKGSKYSLYKKLVCELVVPIDRTGQAESRVFEIQTEYWYRNELTKEFKKVTASAMAIKTEFSDKEGIAEIVKAGGSLARKPDEAMAKIFTSLNQ